MKKLFLSLGAMLVFGIASAQVNNQTSTQSTSGTSQIRTTTRQDNTLAKPKPVITSAESSNIFTNQAPSAVPVTPSPATTNSMTNTPTSSDMSRSSNNSGTATTTSGHVTTGTTSTTRTP
ncbi:hypothetical protein HYN59_08510 [Flavobacterium album]|uniref:Uncharacterized protein n=1 Tax=Flavobacterium album TaxID=2175091 RepID=A0A2S1QY37_9FLAO|nr:hypothetical protein [Flavobacterium album]AWH85161.1 hypothetical protein HYN59_08510 [Flavobacterium album]